MTETSSTNPASGKGPVLILGGGSDIGLAAARRFAQEGHPIQLAARKPETIEADRSDIAIRHNVPVTSHAFDALATEEIDGFFDDLPETPEVVISVIGVLGDQAEAERDRAHADLLVASNYTGPAYALEAAAAKLATRPGPTLVVGVSSVAGDRGRAKNYWYGSAKAAFTVFLSGLRQRYARTPVKVATVKPGFVATKMLGGEQTPKPITATPEKVAEQIWKLKTGSAHVVTIWPWKPIMTILGMVPEPIWKKMKF